VGEQADLATFPVKGLKRMLREEVESERFFWQDKEPWGTESPQGGVICWDRAQKRRLNHLTQIVRMHTFGMTKTALGRQKSGQVGAVLT